MITRIQAPQFTRPADTTQYAAGDLVANNTTAGSVVPLSFDLSILRGAKSGKVTSATLRKSTVTSTAASFILYLFAATSLTVTNGDNGALVVTAGNVATLVGSIPVDQSSSGIAIAGGPLFKAGTPATGVIGFFTRHTALLGLLAAVGTYTPASAETFDTTITVET